MPIACVGRGHYQRLRCPEWCVYPRTPRVAACLSRNVCPAFAGVAVDPGLAGPDAMFIDGRLADGAATSTRDSLLYPVVIAWAVAFADGREEALLARSKSPMTCLQRYGLE
eukprot:scaffold7854_cov28-Tisochrysis_lutea.AAC.2